jgi:hypothetical protein
MGLLTIIRKNRYKEKEMRILFLFVTLQAQELRATVLTMSGGFEGDSITLAKRLLSRRSMGKISCKSARRWALISRRSFMESE